jgi:hypothetical protein
MKIIRIYQELTAQHIQQLANWISTVEQRYDDGQVTSNVANYYKHPTQDIWFFYYNDIANHMGDIGSQIMGFILGTYAPTGNPVINTEVLEIVTLTEAELEEYDPPKPEE